MYKKLAILYFIFFCLVGSICQAHEIDKPVHGDLYRSGDKVTVKVSSLPTENIKQILFAVAGFDANSAIVNHAPFEFEFTIDPRFTGTCVIIADAKMADGSILQKQVSIKVALPQGVELIRIEADPNPVFLHKLPVGSDPKRVRVFEQKSLSVGGVYSDGVEREITSSPDTTFISNNETIVKVTAVGKVTAQNVGTTTITIKNGKFNNDVQVIVKENIR